jgi:hypothetical protein
MRYTKIALLTFGVGLALGLIVVVADVASLARAASGLMALALFAIPLGMMVDWRLATKSPRKPAKRRRAPSRRSASAQPRGAPRPRQPTPPRARKTARPKR